MMLGVVELLFELLFEIIFEGAICGFFGLLAELISAIFEKTGDAIESASEAIEGATEAAISVLRIDDVLWAKQDPTEPDWQDEQ